MDLGLAGRVALVTGATKGIGLAVARALAAEGMNLGVCSRDPAAVAGLVDSLADQGVKAWGRATDVKDGEALGRWVADAAEALGGVDVAVSNPSAMVFQNTEKDWRSVFELDLLGSIRLFDACRPHLVRAGAAQDASFIMISSISALEATQPSPYGALKAALNHYAKGLAVEMAGAGVRANLVSPGNIFVEGGFWDGVKTRAPAYFDQSLKANPTGRMGTAEEVAATVAFLASPRSKFTTGANVVVDGTLTRRV
ncbi:SDR family NAD(P)-dependent oxidoreductase [Phenylobacterium sp.]|jgi:3-oxoacyl-[acyl-carrier protein] reductase|uniref:SDR family NAD(P)-dependent oxidoreductase n=1 Tax=Phenylobacterium sp. TaxID=1871053 RepID=UPI002F3FE489